MTYLFTLTARIKFEIRDGNEPLYGCHSTIQRSNLNPMIGDGWSPSVVDLQSVALKGHVAMNTRLERKSSEYTL